MSIKTHTQFLQIESPHCTLIKHGHHKVNGNFFFFNPPPEMRTLPAELHASELSAGDVEVEEVEVETAEGDMVNCTCGIRETGGLMIQVTKVAKWPGLFENTSEIDLMGRGIVVNNDLN